jgi:hypothetical protein
MEFLLPLTQPFNRLWLGHPLGPASRFLHQDFERPDFALWRTLIPDAPAGDELAEAPRARLYVASLHVEHAFDHSTVMARS